jgi:hypothetical protein
MTPCVHRFRRRRDAPPPIGEAEAYARLHGDRGEDVVRVEPVAPPPPANGSRNGRHDPADQEMTGESLRLAFERRLAARHQRSPR